MPVGPTLGIGPTCLAGAIARHKVVARDSESPINYMMVPDSAVEPLTNAFLPVNFKSMVSPRGIGFAVAEALLREGASVVINGRNEVKLHNAVPK